MAKRACAATSEGDELRNRRWCAAPAPDGQGSVRTGGYLVVNKI